MATALFYALNGRHVPGGTEDELFDLVISVATRSLGAVPEIALQLGAPRRLTRLTSARN